MSDFEEVEIPEFETFDDFLRLVGDRPLVNEEGVQEPLRAKPETDEDVEVDSEHPWIGVLVGFEGDRYSNLGRLYELAWTLADRPEQAHTVQIDLLPLTHLEGDHRKSIANAN